MIQVGIIGGAGYTAGELIRLLMAHPKAQINFVYSRSNAGNKVHIVHQDLIGVYDAFFTDTINKKVDVVFLCLGHENSKAFLEKNIFSKTTKIVDLSNDFRLVENNVFQNKRFVYGLPEINRKEIENSDFIANPGCFATAIQLALLPLAVNGKINSEVHINAVTGASGAGVSLSSTSHFTWRDNNFSHYKAFKHQHLDEIYQTIFFDKEEHFPLNFIPNRGNFSRGIFATVYTEYDDTIENALLLYKAFYKNAAFTFVTDQALHLKQVVNTNKCLLQLEKHGTKLLITSVIDNLVKGASGQAIQNMNLMFGLNETEGLQIKANYF